MGGHWSDLTSGHRYENLRYISTISLTNLWKFKTDRKNDLALALLQTSTKVGSRNLFWWPDLTWPEIFFFAKICAMNVPTKSGSFSFLSPAVWRWDKKGLRLELLKPPPGIGLTRALEGGYAPPVQGCGVDRVFIGVESDSGVGVLMSTPTPTPTPGPTPACLEWIALCNVQFPCIGTFLW